jgi:hypothetical protein
MNYILRLLDLYLNKVHNLVSLLRFIREKRKTILLQKRKARHFLLSSASYGIEILFIKYFKYVIKNT